MPKALSPEPPRELVFRRVVSCAGQAEGQGRGIVISRSPMTTTTSGPLATEQLNAPTGQHLQDLLGNSHSIPVWLSPERFLQPDFDAEEVVLDLRRYVGLQHAGLACTAWLHASMPMANVF